jgi:hypothetical protein
MQLLGKFKKAICNCGWLFVAKGGIEPPSAKLADMSPELRVFYHLPNPFTAFRGF